MKKTGLYGYVYDFSVNYNSIDVLDILDIHKNLKENVIDFLKKKLLTYILCDNVWSENFFYYHKTCFWRKT